MSADASGKPKYAFTQWIKPPRPIFLVGEHYINLKGEVYLCVKIDQFGRGIGIRGGSSLTLGQSWRILTLEELVGLL